MQATDVTATGSSSQTTSSAAASAALTSDFNTFIELLTTQVQNQDPLEPLDSTQFVEQLATFSGLEQQIATNSHLESIASLLQASLGEGGDLLGEVISTPAITASGPFDDITIAAAGVTEGALVVRDSTGAEVYRGPVEGEWRWGGLDAEGNAVGLDTYTFEISTPEGDFIASALSEVERVISTQGGQLVGLRDGVTAATYSVIS